MGNPLSKIQFICSNVSVMWKIAFFGLLKLKHPDRYSQRIHRVYCTTSPLKNAIHQCQHQRDLEGTGLTIPRVLGRYLIFPRLRLWHDEFQVFLHLRSFYNSRCQSSHTKFIFGLFYAMKKIGFFRLQAVCLLLRNYILVII